MSEKESQKELLGMILAEKKAELERFRNMDVLLQADIDSFQKQLADLEKEREDARGAGRR